MQKIMSLFTEAELKGLWNKREAEENIKELLVEIEGRIEAMFLQLVCIY